MMLMGGTILGPGTIFLMLVGAFVAAFRIDNWTSFEYNLYPIAIFMLVCFTMKSEFQVTIVSILFTLVMNAVPFSNGRVIVFNNYLFQANEVEVLKLIIIF